MFPIGLWAVQDTARNLKVPRFRQRDRFQASVVKRNDPRIGKCQQDRGVCGDNELSFATPCQVIHDGQQRQLSLRRKG